jgi:PhoH-like ATPase
VKYVDGKFMKIKYSDKTSEFWGLKALTEEQKFALGLLNDDDIKIVSLTGKSGSAKTILSFAVGLEKKVQNFGAGKLYIARPPVSLSKKLMIGFKKGTVIDKAIGSLGSYSTNLERLSQLRGEKRKIDGSKMLIELMEQCDVNYLNLEDILGMSFSEDDSIIIDEAELLTKSELKAILTRGGKMVIIGDCDQNSENSGVDYENSGLLHLIEVGKKSNLIAHLTLEEIHRGEMVKEINEIW